MGKEVRRETRIELSERFAQPCTRLFDVSRDTVCISPFYVFRNIRGLSASLSI